LGEDSHRDMICSKQDVHHPDVRQPRERSSSSSEDFLDDDEIDEDFGYTRAAGIAFGRKQQGAPEQRLFQVRQSFVTRLKNHSKRTPQVGWLSGLHSSSEEE